MLQLPGACCNPQEILRLLPSSGGHLALTFGGRSKSGRTSSHTAAIETSSYVISEEVWERRLSKNSRQRQRRIEQASQISSLQAQNKKLGQLLEPKFLVETITRAVASNLNMGKT